jgi:hypothetical protein
MIKRNKKKKSNLLKVIKNGLKTLSLGLKQFVERCGKSEQIKYSHAAIHPVKY